MARKHAKQSETAKYGPPPSKAALEAAGHEMKEDEPAILAKTSRKFGPARAAEQRTAILMSKARRGQK